MIEFFAKIKHRYRFTKRETIELIIAILLSALIFGFDDGSETFMLGHWLLNYFNTLLIVALALLIHVSVQKIWAATIGYNATFKMWSYGLAAGVGLALLSGGKFILVLPGGAAITMIATERVGRFRFGLNYGLAGWAAASGSLANIISGMFAKFLFFQALGISNPLIDKFIYVSFLLAFFTMLPLPPLNGLQFFFGQRLGYVLIFGFMLGYVGLFVMEIYSLIFGVLIAVGIWIAYYLLVERKIE